MGEGTTGVGTPPAEQLEREIGVIRGNLAEIVKELNLRRDEVLDWRRQLKRHASALWKAAAAVGAITAGIIVLSIWRSRRRERPIVKAQRLRRALGRIVDDPERVARPRSYMGKVTAATASAAGGLLVKAIAQRALSTPRRPLTAPPQRHVRPAGDGRADESSSRSLKGPPAQSGESPEQNP